MTLRSPRWKAIWAAAGAAMALMAVAQVGLRLDVEYFL